jgi:hypothetical protein
MPKQLVNGEYLLKFAKLHCVFDHSLSRAALIRAIQQAEGNAGCFGTGGSCERIDLNCSWRGECVLVSAACGDDRASPAGFRPDPRPANYCWQGQT